MALVQVGGSKFDIDVIAFDKDGTLIDFDHLWVSRTKTLVQRLTPSNYNSGGGAAGAGLHDALYRSLGVDPLTGQVLADGPLATIPRHKLLLIVATVLYQHGWSWHAAETEAERQFNAVMTATPSAHEIRPIGDVGGLLARLNRAGVKTSVATSDDRKPTEATLMLLSAQQYVQHIVCGDDALPCKPAPDGLLHLARMTGTEPGRMMMVGDSDCDMQTGRSAGVACCVGVLSGTADRRALVSGADVIVEDIQSIAVA